MQPARARNAIPARQLGAPSKPPPGLATGSGRGSPKAILQRGAILYRWKGIDNASAPPPSASLGARQEGADRDGQESRAPADRLGTDVAGFVKFRQILGPMIKRGSALYYIEAIAFARLAREAARRSCRREASAQPRWRTGWRRRSRAGHPQYRPQSRISRCRFAIRLPRR